MKTVYTFLILIIFSHTLFGQAFKIEGLVTDEYKEPMVGVNIFITGDKVWGTTTDYDGKYSLEVKNGDIIVFRFIGYLEQQFSISGRQDQQININMVPSTIELNPVVISASRKKEKILDAPASISVIDAEELHSKAALSITDHIKDIGSVNIMKTSIIGGNPSIRGFNGYMNGDLMMLIDNRIANLPSLRLNFYNLMPATDDDIERVEVLRGPASALYGPNTSNGVIHMITKSPLEEQSTKIWTSIGVRSSIGDTIPINDPKSPRFENNIRGRMMGQIGFRHSGLIPLKNDNLKLGYKVSSQFFQGQDWKYDDPNDPVKVIRYKTTPTGPIELHGNGTPLTAAEIAKGERGDSVTNIRDETSQKFGIDGRFDFNIKNKYTFIFAGGFNVNSGIDMTPIGALQTDKWKYGYFQTRFIWKELFVQAFMNANNSGQTYFVPTGGLFLDMSKFYGLQLQHNVTPLKQLKITYGVDAFWTRPNTGYTLNGKFEDSDNINEYGGYLQAEYEPVSRLSLIVAGRVDHHNILKKVFVSPRAALVYKPGTGQSLRFTFNRAFRTPGSGTYFVDVEQGRFPNGIDIRAEGTQDEGFQYSFDNNPYYNNQLLPQFKSPYGQTTNTYYNVGDESLNNAAWQGILNTIKDQFLIQFGLQGNNVVDGLVDFMIHALVPDTVGGIDQVVQDLNSTTKSFQASDWQNIHDISKLRQVTTNNFEIGYKGVIGKMLGLSLDLYRTQYKDYMAPVTFVTPGVLFDAAQLIQYLSPILAENLDKPENAIFNSLLIPLLDKNPNLGGNNNGTPEDELLALIQQAVEHLPIGVITPTNTTGPTMLLVSRNIGDVLVYGIDASISLYINKDAKVFINYSWVNKDSIPVPGAQFGYVALNAPKHRLNIGFNYNVSKIGLSVGARFKWQAGFPVSSGNFVGHVEPFNDMDIDLSWTPTFFPKFNSTLSVQNIYGNKHQYFIGSPYIGTMALMKLSYTL